MMSQSYSGSCYEYTWEGRETHWRTQLHCNPAFWVYITIVTFINKVHAKHKYIDR